MLFDNLDTIFGFGSSVSDNEPVSRKSTQLPIVTVRYAHHAYRCFNSTYTCTMNNGGRRFDSVREVVLFKPTGDRGSSPQVVQL
jgi:hypothetical protein